MALTEEERKELFLKYKQKIEGQIGTTVKTEEPEVTYSQAYKVFKEEQLGLAHTLFERLCASAERLLQVKIKQSDIDKMQPSLEMAHINATPQGVYSLAILSALLSVFAFFAIGILFANLTVMLAGLFVSLGLFLYIPSIPKRMFAIWRAKASDQIVLAVLYMIIYMEHTPNLELATWFAAKHLPPPLSLDFIKVLWDVETKKYSNITAALEDYISTWRGWDDAFIDAVHVLETSLVAQSKSERLKILEKSEEIILEGTFDKMMSYAHNLQSPIETLHMLGTVLPIMGLVMLPMVSAFMGETVKWWHIAILYNLLLPLGIYGISRSVLSVRPAGSNVSDVYLHLAEKYVRPEINLFGLGVRIPPWLVGAIVFVLVSLPAIFYFTVTPPTGEQAFETTPLIFSTLMIAGLGLGLGAYYWYNISSVVKIKRKIALIEEEFASAIFQLGNKMAGGTPVETAIPAVMEAMPKAEVTDFFRIIDSNIRERGLSLRDAIFDKKLGALTYYPSAIIKSVMNTLVEAAKKSPQIAASSLIAISKYLANVHRVNERLKDLLADTISSMSSQIKLFAPAISGIVVGLSSLTTQILGSLGAKLRGFEAGSDVPGFGTGLLSVFQVDEMLPAWQFQFIVGLYLIQVVAVLSIMLNGVVNGADKVEEQNTLATNLLIASAFYAILTIITAVFFSGLVGSIVAEI